MNKKFLCLVKIVIGLAFVVAALVTAFLLGTEPGVRLQLPFTSITPNISNSAQASLATASSQQGQGLPNFVSLAKRLSPAVVNISTTQVSAEAPFSQSPFGEEDPFRRFFGGPFPRGPSRQKSLGSGFIIDREGLILTNNHVVENAEKIVVRLSDKRDFEAKVEWDESNLDELLKTHAEENINREFKRAEALGDKLNHKRTEECKVEISKDVSSFSNSTGGVIIYGLEEEKKAPHEAKAISPIDPEAFSKEWLEQVINSRIKPPIQGLKINPIELKKAHSGKLAYVVMIPPSFTALQAYDKRYYKRYNFQSVAMEDYEVRLTMNRAQKPAFEVQVYPSSSDKEVSFRGRVLNTSELVGHEISLVLLLPDELAKLHPSYAQYEDIAGLKYIQVPGAELFPTLGPLNSEPLYFPSNSLVIPSPMPAFGCTAFVRVYDQFGRAAEAEFRVTLFPDPGKVYDLKIRRREELYS